MVAAANEDNMDVDEAPKARKQLPSVLDTFSLLRDAGDNFKLDAGAKLLAFLAKSEDEKNLDYALKRIIRSLAANQVGARTGYFSTLVVLLNKFQDITVDQLLKLVKQELLPNGSKSDLGDVLVGQILVCGAVLRSRLVLRASESEQHDVLALLFTASAKKSYLKSAAYLFLVNFVDTLDEQQFKSIVWTNIKAELKKSIQEQNIDSLYFLLKAEEKFPGVMKVRNFLGTKEIICEDTMHAICEKLMSVADMNQVNHPIYQYVSIAMANSEHLKLFWTSGIDSHLTKHNRNRELVAIKLLTTVLDNIKSNHEVIPELLTNNFFKLFLDWFKGLQTASKIRNRRDDEDDNKMMIKKEKEVLNALAKAVKPDGINSSVKVEVLKKLLFNPGDMNLAEVTGTAAVKTIITSMNKEGVKKTAKLFKAVLLNESKKFVKEGTERAWFNYERLKASEYLSHLVTHPAVLDDTKFRLNYMKLLMCFGFFKIGGNENVSISADLSATIKTSFYRCLNHRSPTVESLVETLRSLCGFIDENLSDNRVGDKLLKQFPKENMECWVTLKRVCDTIEDSSDQKKVDRVFLILLYQLGLFLFSEPKYVEVAKGSVKELVSCYEHYKKGGKKKSKKPKEGDLSEDEPEWIEVLIEVLLSILSTESSVLRAAVQCAFRLLWEYLTPSSIGQIVSVLDPDSDSNPLMQDDEDSEDSDSDDDETENGKNESEDNAEENENNDEESASDTEPEEDDDEEQMKIPDQLRLAVQKALGSAAPDTDTESVDADDIDEEEGKKLDKALSEAFKLLRQGKNNKSKKDRKDKKILTDFRVRVLDLVDVYLEKEPAMDICLGMLAPLMRCLEFCIQDNDQRELESRVRKTLKSLTSIKKFSSAEGVTEQLLGDYLKATIEKGSRSQFIFQALADMVTECGAFLVHCSQKIQDQKAQSKKKHKSPLLEIYEESIVSFFRNRSCLLPIIFFHKILKIDWVGNYELVPIIIENAFSASVRQFRRHEGLELLVGFYTTLKRLKPENSTERLKPIELAFEQTVKEAFRESNEEFVVKDQFLKLLQKTFVHVERFYACIEEVCPMDLKALSQLVAASKKGMKIKREKKEQEQKENASVGEKKELSQPVAASKKGRKAKREKKKQEQKENAPVIEKNGSEANGQKRKKEGSKPSRSNLEPKQKKIKS